LGETPKAGAKRTVKQAVGNGARELPKKSHGWFRDWFRTVWKVRGGGLYAVGFAMAFLYFEIGSLGDDILGIGSLFNGQALDFIIDFSVDSFMNTMKAFMWPVYVVRLAPPWGAIDLGLAFVGFTSFLKAPVERWLFGETPEANTDPR
jgi:hypothetical protein